MSTYSFLDVHCGIIGPGGAINLGSGAATSDEGITIEPNEAINTLTVGADGSAMHSLHANKSGKVSVSLLKTSPVNQLLSLMYAFQTASGSNHGKNTITLANNQTGDVVTCQVVAFSKAPSLKYQKEGGMNVWEFEAGIIDRLLGRGN